MRQSWDCRPESGIAQQRSHSSHAPMLSDYETTENELSLKAEPEEVLRSRPKKKAAQRRPLSNFLAT